MCQRGFTKYWLWFPNFCTCHNYNLICFYFLKVYDFFLKIIWIKSTYLLLGREGEEKLSGMVATAGVRVCVCVCVCCDATPMWFKGWKAEMKQSVLDRNVSWLSSEAKAKRGQDGSSLEMQKLKRDCAWKKKTNSLEQSGKTKTKNETKQAKREKRENLCKHLLQYVSVQTAAQPQVYWDRTLICSTKLTLMGSVAFCFI